MNATTKTILGLALLALPMLTACGGGGGGGNGGGDGGRGVDVPVFTLTDTTVPRNLETAEVEVAIDLQGTAPVLMQFDVEVGSAAMSLEGSEAVRALQARGVDFEPLDEERRTARVVFGDAGRTDAITAGAIVRLKFTIDDTREDGTFEVRIRNILVADAEGNAIARDDLAKAEVVGRITLQ